MKFETNQGYIYIALKYVMWSISTFLVVPVSYSFSVILDCRTYDGVSYFLFVYPQTRCFTPFHSVLFGFGVFGHIGVLIVSYLIAVYDNDLRFSNNSIFKKFTPITLFIMNLSVSKLVLLTEIVNQRNIVNEYLVILFLVLIFIFYQINESPIFFHTGLSKITIFFWANYVCAASCLIYENSFQTSTALYWFLILIIIIGCYVSSINLQYFKVQFKNSLVIKDEREYLFHFQSLSLFVKTCMEKNDGSPLMEMIYQHRTLCYLEDCPLRFALSFEKTKSKRDELNQSIFKETLAYINLKFVQGVSLYPQNLEIQLSYCLFLAQFMNQPNTAFEYLMRFKQNKKLSLYEKFYVFTIKEFLSSMNPVDNQRESIIVMEANVSLKTGFTNEFQGVIEKLTYISLDFWENVKQDQVDFRKMVNLNSNFVKELKKVQVTAQNRVITSKTELKLFYVYSQFLHYILGEDEESLDLLQDLLKKLRQLNDIQNNDLNIGPNYNFADLFFPALLLDVTSKIKNEIIKINVEMEILLGYNPHEIPQISIDTIIPEFFREPHEHIISKYLKNIDRKDKYRKKFILPLQKSGYVTPVIANMKYIESTINDSKFIFCAAISDPVFDSSYFMMLDSKMNIVNVSQNCATDFQMNLANIQKNNRMKFWILNLQDFVTEFKNSKFVENLVFKNMKTGVFEKEQVGFFHVETVVWDLTPLTDFKCLIIKLDRITNPDQQRLLQEFSMNEIYNFKLKDKTMETYLIEANENQSRSKNIKMPSYFTKSGNMKGTSGQDEDTDRVLEEYFFKNVKLLKMKKNRLYEIDFTQLDNLQDREVLDDEFEQFCIDSNLDHVRTTDNVTTNEKERVIKYDFTHSKKFKRFIELYHKRFSVSQVTILLFFAVFTYVGFILFNLQVNSIEVQNMIAYDNISILSMQKLENFILTVQDIQVASILKQNSFQVTDDAYLQISQRIRTRITNIRNCSYYIVNQQNLFSFSINVTVFKDQATSETYDFYVLENWLMARMSQLADPNMNITLFQQTITGLNNITMFILQNVIGSYYPASVEMINQIDLQKKSFRAQHTLINFLIKSLPIVLMVIFIGIYFYFLFNTNSKNLKLLTIYLQVPDDLIEKQIGRIQHLLVVIKKILYEEKIVESKNNQVQNVARTKTIYRKKLFKNHRDLFNLKLFLIIATPIILMVCYNIAEFFIGTSFLSVTDYLMKNSNVLAYEYPILSDFNTVFMANLPYQIALNSSTTLDALKSSGKVMSNTINLMFYQFVHSDKYYSDSYKEAFSTVIFGDVCANTLIYNATDASLCETRFGYFGNPGVSTITNYMETLFFTLQNKTISASVNNSSFAMLFNFSKVTR